MPAALPATCCTVPDTATQKPCNGCGSPVCKNCRSFVNGLIVCVNCRSNVEAAVAAESSGALGLPFAITGGVIAAIIAGAVWAGLAIFAKVEIGYAAIGVGFLVGWGVFLGAGKKRGFHLQVVAVACAALSLLFSKYLIVANAICDYLVKEGVYKPGEVSMFKPEIVKVFFQNIGTFLTPWDGLWLVLALVAAWKVPAPSGLKVS